MTQGVQTPQTPHRDGTGDGLAFASDVNRAMRGTLALVLAGGRGSRLMDLTEKESKPAVPFGGKYRIVDFPLSNCINSGLRRICVLTQYKAHTLIHHVQRGWGFLRAEIGEFVELWPAQQQTAAGSWYQGTADAVYQNIEQIQTHGADYILVLAGDHVYRQDYSRMMASHLRAKADCTIACIEVPREQATAFGVVHVDEDDNIISFLEKPADPPCIPGKPDRAFVSMGNYLFSADFLLGALEDDARNPQSARDFGKNIIPEQIGKARIVAHRFEESCVHASHTPEAYWRDVGTLDAYWAANMDLVGVTPDLDLYDPAWPIWTYTVQRPGAKFVFDEDERRGMAVDSVLSAGCIVSGGSVSRSLLFHDVRVNSFSEVEDSVLLPGVDVGRHARIRKAIVAAGAHIPPNMVIGEDAEADAKRFLRTEGGVTLVTPEMLDKLDA
ncbi:glucose-1-phosphate adenylyltransferase [Roseospira visakhapatnamensis]|uniref:Glucose-1-phosphate adenylyltransferase n=2 Tax=Roseospira visakhapatnamensis TaxID=390880 RepID=A0A7W6RD26_9PROT|nr:glucose-1-phosphate adenylyltransferase [Roseospira visakhapatnamensis]